MSEELEAAGALVTAAAVAGRVDAAQGEKAHAEAAPADHDGAICRNCGAALQGAYCHACGQSAHLYRSLLHLVEEVLHGVLHFDAKGWRTLPLLVARPGLLTRRYIDGQRMRYVSPLALFLFTVFLMFFVASFSNVSSEPAGPSDDSARAELEKSIADARVAEARAEAAIGAARSNAEALADAKEALGEARSERAVAQAALRVLEIGTAASATSAAASASAAGVAAPAGAPDWRAELRSTAAPTGIAWLDAAIHRAVDNPDLLVYKLKNSAYKFSFMLVPISLPFLWLLFALRRDVAVYDHAVFVLYSLSFMSLLLIAVFALAPTGWGRPIATLALLAVPVHMALQLREAYGLGMLATLWRTAALLVVACLALLLFVTFIAYLAAG
ncbi:MAG TPA: DUF3667 domain-containing protein [Caldimonas sp.]|jgi:hypothetical protein